LLAAVTPLYLVMLALASFAKPGPSARPIRLPDLIVLVPAHNESEFIARCVRSLCDQSYPPNQYRVVVIADNCTDSTASVAVAAGAEVMVRSDLEHRGKGQALRWAMDKLLGAAEAIVVVDADSVADTEMLMQLAASYAAGHESVQADDLLRSDTPSLRGELEAIALLLRNQVRFAGRAALGMPASLCGNGMLFSAAVLRQHPWSAFSGVEDGEYSLTLREAGIATAFAPAAKVYASTTSGGSGAYTQGIRWEGGRFQMMATGIPRLLRAAARRRDLRLLSTVLDVAMLPLSAALAALTLGSGAALLVFWLGVIPIWPVVPWLVGLFALPLYVVIALVSARQPLRSYLALAAVPYFFLLKLRVYVRLLQGFDSGWVRTQRPAEKAPPTVRTP
jgi:cellulose synthase/poly-beta-1,6-N-acetylglucosamine synthase-like glycosyltransferase